MTGSITAGERGLGPATSDPKMRRRRPMSGRAALPTAEPLR